MGSRNQNESESEYEKLLDSKEFEDTLNEFIQNENLGNIEKTYKNESENEYKGDISDTELLISDELLTSIDLLSEEAFPSDNHNNFIITDNNNNTDQRETSNNSKTGNRKRDKSKRIYENENIRGKKVKQNLVEWKFEDTLEFSNVNNSSCDQHIIKYNNNNNQFFIFEGCVLVFVHEILEDGLIVFPDIKAIKFLGLNSNTNNNNNNNESPSLFLKFEGSWSSWFRFFGYKIIFKGVACNIILGSFSESKLKKNTDPKYENETVEILQTKELVIGGEDRNILIFDWESPLSVTCVINSSRCLRRAVIESLFQDTGSQDLSQIYATVGKCVHDTLQFISLTISMRPTIEFGMPYLLTIIKSIIRRYSADLWGAGYGNSSLLTSMVEERVSPMIEYLSNFMKKNEKINININNNNNNIINRNRNRNRNKIQFPNLRSLRVEQSILSLRYGIRGVIDILGESLESREKCAIELKTGKSAPEHKAQLTMYEYLMRDFYGSSDNLLQLVYIRGKSITNNNNKYNNKLELSPQVENFRASRLEMDQLMCSRNNIALYKKSGGFPCKIDYATERTCMYCPVSDVCNILDLSLNPNLCNVIDARVLGEKDVTDPNLIFECYFNFWYNNIRLEKESEKEKVNERKSSWILVNAKVSQIKEDKWCFRGKNQSEGCPMVGDRVGVSITPLRAVNFLRGVILEVRESIVGKEKLLGKEKVVGKEKLLGKEEMKEVNNISMELIISINNSCSGRTDIEDMCNGLDRVMFDRMEFIGKKREVYISILDSKSTESEVKRDLGMLIKFHRERHWLGILNFNNPLANMNNNNVKIKIEEKGCHIRSLLLSRESAGVIPKKILPLFLKLNKDQQCAITICLTQLLDIKIKESNNNINNNINNNSVIAISGFPGSGKTQMLSILILCLYFLERKSPIRTQLISFTNTAVDNLLSKAISDADSLGLYLDRVSSLINRPNKSNLSNEKSHNNELINMNLTAKDLINNILKSQIKSNIHYSINSIDFFDFLRIGPSFKEAIKISGDEYDMRLLNHVPINTLSTHFLNSSEMDEVNIMPINIANDLCIRGSRLMASTAASSSNPLFFPSRPASEQSSSSSRISSIYQNYIESSEKLIKIENNNNKTIIDLPTPLDFDVLIIDEAGQLLDSNIWSSLLNTRTQVIIVGDSKQLPPLVKNPKCVDVGMGVSLFQRVVDGFDSMTTNRNDSQHVINDGNDVIDGIDGNDRIPIVHLNETSVVCVKLRLQYRMNDVICSLASNLFYEGLMYPGNSIIANRRLSHNIIKSNNKIKGWVISSITGGSTKIVDTKKITSDIISLKLEELCNDTSLKRKIGIRANKKTCSIEEALVILQIFNGFENLINRGDQSSSIMVLSPYRDQLALIKELSDGRIPTSTIDRAQGLDWDIVIISIVSQSDDRYGNDIITNDIILSKKKVSSFISDSRRIGVAITRAKVKLIIVGNTDEISKMGSPMDRLIEGIEEVIEVDEL